MRPVIQTESSIELLFVSVSIYPSYASTLEFSMKEPRVEGARAEGGAIATPTIEKIGDPGRVHVDADRCHLQSFNFLH